MLGQDRTDYYILGQVKTGKAWLGSVSHC